MADDSKAGSGRTRNSSDAVQGDLFAVRITVTRESFDSLMKKFDLDIGCRPHVHASPEGSGILTAFATRDRIRELESAGYAVEVGENASELGRRRQEEVGKGDRFEGGRIVPRGLGEKTDDGGHGGSAR